MSEGFILSLSFLSMDFSLKGMLSVTLILFGVIDILGSIPVIIDLRKKNGHIKSLEASFIAAMIMIVFLFLGESILGLFGTDIESFAIAGSLVMFLIGMEMVLGIHIFAPDTDDHGGAHVMPIAFPLIAGAGTMTTLISLKVEYSYVDIITGVILNILFVYFVLRNSSKIEKAIGPGGTNILRKVFGIILLSIAIKIFKNVVLGM